MSLFGIGVWYVLTMLYAGHYYLPLCLCLYTDEVCETRDDEEVRHVNKTQRLTVLCLHVVDCWSIGVNMLFIHTYLSLPSNMGLICCWDHHVHFLFPRAAIPQALLHVTLTMLQSAALHMSKDPESLCVLMQYIPVAVVGKLLSLPIRMSFSKSVISAWVGF